MQNFLRPAEVQQCHKELEACETQIKMIETGFAKDIDGATVENVLHTRASIKKRLEQEPPDLTPQQRDRVAKRIKQLEGEISVGMLSSEEMRRNPHDAVPKNIEWQKNNGKKVTELKNLQLALHKGESQEFMDRMLNIERLRPRESRLGMDGARINTTTYVHGYGDQIDWDWGKSEAEKTAIELLDEADDQGIAGPDQE